MRSIPTLLFVEAVVFAVAALVHFGVLVDGYQHAQARLAESLISVTLLGGLAVGLLRPAWARSAALVAQGLALLGTLVGMAMIAIGVGPRTIPDVVYHVGIVIVLVWGLTVAQRAAPETRAAA
jgi:hypothetical protein